MSEEVKVTVENLTTIGGCATLVTLITSTIHHLIGEVKSWWSPKWGSFVLALVVGAISQLTLFKGEITPVIGLVIAGNICLIYCTAVGINSAIGKPGAGAEGRPPAGALPTSALRGGVGTLSKETWRNRWFS